MYGTKILPRTSLVQCAIEVIQFTYLTSVIALNLSMIIFMKEFNFTGNCYQNMNYCLFLQSCGDRFEVNR